MKSRAALGEAQKRLRERHGVAEWDGGDDPIAQLSAGLAVQPEPKTQLVRIAFESADPGLSVLVSNTIAESYMDLNLSRSLEANRQALAWLQEQQEIYRQRKHESDVRVQQFKDEHQLYGPNDQTLSAAALAERQAAWSTAHTQRVKAKFIRDELARIEGSSGWTALAGHLSGENDVLREMHGRPKHLAEDRGRLDAGYLPGHPEMVWVDAEIQTVDAQLRSRVTAIVAGRNAEVALHRSEEERLGEEMERFKGDMAKLGRDRMELGMLTALAERDELFYRNRDLRMSEVGLSQSLQPNNPRFVDRAIPPRSAARPQVLVNVFTAPAGVDAGADARAARCAFGDRKGEFFSRFRTSSPWRSQALLSLGEPRVLAL